MGRATYEPGWRWTLDMPDITGTSTCQVHDLGYSISGVMHVATDDRQHVDIDPGTKDLLEGSGLMLEDAGVVALKGIAGERHVFRVAAVATTTQEKIT